MRVAFTIYGEPCSKANSRRIVWRDGAPRSIKSEKALAFESAALLQVPTVARVMYAGDVAVTMRIYYRDRRSDLDESLVLDVLQARFAQGGALLGNVARRGVYVNDRQVKEKHIYHAVDSKAPRVEVVVETAGGV